MKDINEIAKELAGGLSLDQLRSKQDGDRSDQRRPKTPEEIEREWAYWEKVMNPTPTPNAGPRPRIFTQEMEYELAKRELWKIFQERAYHISINEDRDFRWQFTESDGANIRNMLKWFINDPSGALPINRGLYIYGARGTGKTEVIDALRIFAANNKLQKQFISSRMSDIYQAAKADKDFDPVTVNVQFDRIFDEFARFTGPVKRFGDDLDINEAIMEQREARYKSYGQLTILISNGSKEQVEPVLSSMLFDRVRSFTSDVHFEGESKRGN